MNSFKLEKLLEKAAKDPAYRPAFYDALMQSDLVVLYQPDANQELKNGIVHLKKDTTVKIKEFQAKDGRRIIPIFTSVAAFQKGIKTEEAYLQFGVRTLFEITKGASYILNPYSDCAKEFSPEEVEMLLSETVSKEDKNVIEKGAKVIVGQPKEYPSKLIHALKKYFSRLNIIRSAYLVQVFIPNKDKHPHLMIGINMPYHNEKVLRNTFTVVQPYLKKDEFIDIMVVNLNSEIIKGVKPFFKNNWLNKLKNYLALRFL